MFNLFKKKKFNSLNLTKKQTKYALKKVDILLYVLKEKALKEMTIKNDEELRTTKVYPEIEKLMELKHILIMGYDLSQDDLNLLNSI